ncbi:MAG: ATP-binding protein [Clostridia bacterium]|nr:ATP-binding protein [Clostridia bacterium]
MFGDINKKAFSLDSDFKDIVSNFYFVDKSLLIKDLIDEHDKATLITRPRRFGKSLSLSMLETFFEKTESDTSVYFKDLKIWNCGEKYRAEQGMYPVIHLNLKGPAGSNWEELYSDIKDLIAEEYKRHSELKNGVDEADLEKYESIKTCSGSFTQYKDSLRFLCKLLYRCHGVRPIILLDEYDHPIQEAVEKNYYDEAIGFFKPFLSNALKDNENLAFAVIMGITRVSKEGIFSGLNNLRVCSVTNETYSRYFGFTEDEVKGILSDFGHPEKYEETCEWYDGYKFGQTEIFNPWSVINYVACKFVPERYWVNTSGNGIMRDLLFSADEGTREKISVLMDGGQICHDFDENITYKDLEKDQTNVFSLMLMSGYLKCVGREGDVCRLMIPNKEIRGIYKTEILEKFGRGDAKSSGQIISEAIKKKDAAAFRDALSHYITTCVDYTLLQNENAYAILTAGILIVLDNVYYIIPEEKLPLARPDHVLIPKDEYKNSLPAVILEYEKCKKKGELPVKAQKGRNQIDDKGYDARLKAYGHADIFKLGVAFCGGDVAVATEYKKTGRRSKKG